MVKKAGCTLSEPEEEEREEGGDLGGPCAAFARDGHKSRRILAGKFEFKA